MEKHVKITTTDDNLTFKRNVLQIKCEASFDGIYVVRTELDADALSHDDAVLAYMHLARVERAFRNTETGQLDVWTLCVYNPDRVRAHVFLSRFPCTCCGTCTVAVRG